MDKQRQELHCHACNNYVQFDIDVEQQGNHVIICPNCGHEHCRVVRNGIITEARWDRRNGGYVNFNPQTAYYNTGVGWTSSSVYTTYVVNSGVGTDTAAFTYGSWNNGGTGSQGYC
jgi:hypothetical protein